MKTKTCSHCAKSKAISMFSKRKNNTTQSWCKACCNRHSRLIKERDKNIDTKWLVRGGISDTNNISSFNQD